MAETPADIPAEIRREPSGKRVRAYLDGALVADTVHPLLVWEHPRYPTYYLPAADVPVELTEAGGRTAEFGAATMYDVHAGGTVAPSAALRYPEVPELAGFVRLDWHAMSEWLEEDEPVYVHPRDPYTRVDALASSRHVVVRRDGVLLAESRRPTILFETGHPPRYYLPMPDVRPELLRPSPTRTGCPYKGTAEYVDVELDGVRHENLLWCYRTPLPEAAPIAGLLCFAAERVELTVDGERV